MQYNSLRFDCKIQIGCRFSVSACTSVDKRNDNDELTGGKFVSPCALNCASYNLMLPSKYDWDLEFHCRSQQQRLEL